MQCIEWQQARNPKGYGWKRVDGSSQLAHRVVFEQAWGIKIPAGMVVMHTCDNPSCVNPMHLRLGTQKQNMEDCAAKGRIVSTQGDKTHCPKGHEYSIENTWTDGKRRNCRACARENQRRYRHA